MVCIPTYVRHAVVYVSLWADHVLLLPIVSLTELRHRSNRDKTYMAGVSVRSETLSKVVTFLFLRSVLSR